MKIFGAGMAGLMAAMANPKAKVYEKNDRDFTGHAALLRFRTEDVSKLTGIKFRKVKVVKSIWSEGAEHRPTPRLVAKYSMKNTGVYENRSIMDISTTERFIAPDDFQDILRSEIGDRVFYNYEVSELDFLTGDQIISTLPLFVNAKMLGHSIDIEKSSSKIYVSRLKIYDCDMFSTVYYPDESFPVYRASLTGSTLIIESKSEIVYTHIEEVLESMGLVGCGSDYLLSNHIQPMGKMSAINDSERRVLIYKMSHDHGVFSLGRFALHKNILLDDVVKDIQVIKEMINDDSYGISVRDRL